MPEVKLHMGALAEPINKQLAAQGVTLPAVDRYQNKADAITLLYVTGLLIDSEANKSRKRLMRQITKEAEKA